MTNITGMHISSVSPSTALDDQQRARRLPPDLLAKTNALLDQLDNLQAKQAQAQQRGQHAGKARATTVQAAIKAMCEQHRLQLSRWTGSTTSKAVFIHKAINNTIEKEGSWQQLTKPPHVRTIFKVINGLRM